MVGASRADATVGAIGLTGVGAIALTLVDAIVLTRRCDRVTLVGADWTDLSVNWTYFDPCGRG